MKISKILTKRLSLTTASILLLISILAILVGLYLNGMRIKSAFLVQGQSASAIARDQYRQGNLIAMRNGLDALAHAHGWIKGSFETTVKEPMWTMESSEVKGISSSWVDTHLWRMVAWFVGFSTQKTPFFIQLNVPVNDDDGSRLGELIISRSVLAEYQEFKDFVIWGIGVISIFWVASIVACWFVSQRSLKSLHSLLEDLKQEGKKVSLEFNDGSKLDEVSTVHQWFQQLVMSWTDAQDKIVSAQKFRAIAGLTQMLAHDVRKPFSMLKTGLGMLQASSNDPQKFKTNLNLLISEVERATKSVDGMLSDVMEIGAPTQELLREPVAPEALIESTLGEIFRVYPKSHIHLHYQLQHSHMVSVHPKKINRLFANILGNALQAMNFRGNIWFKTQTKDNYVQFCIGNSGSSIPEENLQKLFEAFFTSGKKSGTGLGLAIAQKVVHAHGGQIWCQSEKNSTYPEGQVEFYFTLPIDPGTPLATTALLPHHSSHITQRLALLDDDHGGNPSDNHHLKLRSEPVFSKSEELLQQELLEKVQTKNLSSLHLLLVDDESIYRSALAAWIEDSPELRAICTIHHGKNSSEALQIIKKHTIHLIITDIDMGPASLNGFELVKELRTAHHYKSLIFVHSNRIVPDDHKRAGNLGADGFLPKPMARGQLLKLLLQTLSHPAQQNAAVFPAASPGLSEAPQAALMPAAQSPSVPLPTKKIAIIDDEVLFRDQWPPFLKGFQTLLFASAEDFLTEWNKFKERPDNLQAVITDKCLGAGMDGVAFATLLRTQDPHLPIILSTNDLGFDSGGERVFDLVVDKDASLEAPKIIQYLGRKEIH